MNETEIKIFKHKFYELLRSKGKRFFFMNKGYLESLL